MGDQPDAETRVEMTSYISVLSLEELNRIFHFLAEDKQTIAVCRLVCRSFRDHCSQYLVTRVVFARRLKTIARLNEIVEHEYFHKYVTELVCDVSCYCENRATDWDTYVEACLNAPQQLRDPKWIRRKLEDRAIWSKIEELGNDREEDTNSGCARPLDCDRDTEHDGAWARDEAGEQTSDNDLSETVGDDVLFESDDDDDDDDEDDDISEDSGSSSEYEDGALRYYDQAYNLGCHKSFPDYHRLYVAERQMGRKDTTERVLGRALSKLKSLKSIVVTDWRGLARPDESYSDCAHRLFGNTLAPNLMLPINTDSTRLFEEIVYAIEDNKDVSIKHFSTGSHFFEDETHQPNDPRGPICIPWHAVGYMHVMVERLRHLCLALNINPELLEHWHDDMPAGSQDEVRHTLSQASNLEHLTLAIRLPEGPRRLGNTDQVKGLFSSWLAVQYFSRLKTIGLRGWVLPEALLKEFLARHASTLRATHFINCYVIGDQVSLADWAGKNLDLDGVEISLTSGTHVYSLQGQLDGTIEEIPVGTALKPANEPAWLAGRPNFIVREPLSGSLRSDGPIVCGLPWWEKRGRKQS